MRGERATSTRLGLMSGCPEAQETVAWREVGAEEVSVGVRHVHVHVVITRWQGMPSREKGDEGTRK